MVGNNLDFTADTGILRDGEPLRRPASGEPELDYLRGRGQSERFSVRHRHRHRSNPRRLYGPEFPDTRISRLTDIAGSFEDRLKITPAFALIGGVRLEALTLDRSGTNFDGTVPDGLPFSKTWTPVSYRAAYTYEPIHNLMFYSMYATAYDPAVAGIFSITPANCN